jgi:hypothetical protein
MAKLLSAIPTTTHSFSLLSDFHVIPCFRIFDSIGQTTGYSSSTRDHDLDADGSERGSVKATPTDVYQGCNTETSDPSPAT